MILFESQKLKIKKLVGPFVYIDMILFESQGQQSVQNKLTLAYNTMWASKYSFCSKLLECFEWNTNIQESMKNM
jgi:hypothetical protein